MQDRSGVREVCQSFKTLVGYLSWTNELRDMVVGLWSRLNGVVCNTSGLAK